MKKRATGALAVVVLSVAVALVLLTFRSASTEVAYPVERLWHLATRRLWPRVAGCFHASAVAAENAELKREIGLLKLIGGDMNQLAAENARLRKALGYAEHVKRDWVVASVLSRDGGAAGMRDTLRIGRGSLDGVKKGATVVVPEGLVGRVTSVSPHTAEVLLVTDPSLHVACEVESQLAVPMRGILSGGSDSLLAMRYLTSSADIPPRSRVITSGIGGVFPRGIEVGTWVAEGEVLPSVEYSTLEDVFIRCDR